MTERRSKPQPRPKDGKKMAASAVKASWNASKARQSYANICNVTTTREEVFLLFGINRAWQGNQEQVTVELTDRIILNPHTAKRLSAVLERVIREYECRFGELPIDSGASKGSGTSR